MKYPQSISKYTGMCIFFTLHYFLNFQWFLTTKSKICTKLSSPPLHVTVSPPFWFPSEAQSMLQCLSPWKEIDCIYSEFPLIQTPSRNHESQSCTSLWCPFMRKVLYLLLAVHNGKECKVYIQHITVDFIVCIIYIMVE